MSIKPFQSQVYAIRSRSQLEYTAEFLLQWLGSETSLIPAT